VRPPGSTSSSATSVSSRRPASRSRSARRHLAVSGTIRTEARAKLAEAGLPGGPFAAAHVASFAHEAKRWPEERFAALFEKLARERGLPVVLLGSAAEAPMNARVAALAPAARVVDLAGQTTLPEVLGVVAEAELFVGNDSGLAHLANAAGTPTTVVFGPTDPTPRAPGTAPARRPPRPPPHRPGARPLRPLPIHPLSPRPRLHARSRGPGRLGPRRRRTPYDPPATRPPP